MKFVVGRIFDPNKKKFRPVVGHDFPNAPNYYQFYVLGSNDHFRKEPDVNNDEIQEISSGIYSGLYDDIKPSK